MNTYKNIKTYMSTHMYTHTHMYTYTHTHKHRVVILRGLSYQDGYILTKCYPRWRHLPAQVNILNTLGHVDNTEKEIRSVKRKMAHTSSPSSSSDTVSSKKVQIDVPNIIRVSTLVFQLVIYCTYIVTNSQSI